MWQSYFRKHHTDDLLKWPMLQMLEFEFLRTIHMAFVCDKQALLLTKDDKVYGIGYNSLGCFKDKTPREVNYFHPREIVDLSHKGIQTFSFCKDSTVVALSKAGEVYFSEGTEFVKIPIDTVIQVASQQNYFFTLDVNKKVLAWKRSRHDLALSSHRVDFNPLLKVICIKTTHDAIVSLMEDGNVYTIIKKQYDDLISTKMPEGVKIVKIACGYSHTLALSDTGQVYAWGSNASGQLGCPLHIQSSSNDPQQVSASTMGRVIEIAATHHCDISVAATAYGKVYMWGNCGGIIVRTPLLVPYTSIHEVFAKFASVRLMHEPLIIEMYCFSNNVIDSLTSAFDDENTSDFTIIVEGKPIHVHKAILKITSEHFRRMFEANLAENNNNIMEHKEFPYVVYKAYLKYLYTGKLDMPLRDALDLLLLANVYLDTQLQNLCQELVLHEISISNVLYVYVTTRRHSIQNLEKISRNFILSHLTDVVKTKDFSSLDGDIAKELMIEAADKGFLKK